MKDIKLNLGSGDINLGKDWTHLDGKNGQDITDLEEYWDESVDIIYASHVLEYFDQIEVVDVLREWWRVLKKGGTLRLAVPDFEILCQLYLQKEIINEIQMPLTGEIIKLQNPKKIKIRDLIGPLFGRMEMDGEMIYHKTTYDYETLAQLLYNCGFKRIKRYDWQTTKPHNKVDDQSQCYFPHMDKENGTLLSLNLECTK